MPFGFLKKMFKKTATDLTTQVAGADAAKMVGDQIDQIDEDQVAQSLLTSFTGKQASGLQSLFGSVGGEPSAVESHASSKGLDPALISGLVSMLSQGDKSSNAGASGGFDLSSLLQVATTLTKGGGGGGGLDGLLGLLGGGGGGGGGGSSSLLGILLGLAKSFFAMQMSKNKNAQDWKDAGAGADDNSFNNWGDKVIGDLIDPDKKDKDRINDNDDNRDKDIDLPSKDDDDDKKSKVKGWFDDHPEIGKMQKDVFDDIFDTTDEDDDDRLSDDPAPLIPAPKGFQPDCSQLDQASILFLNSKILLDLRKEWRFLYSFKSSSDRSLASLVDTIALKGPTLVLIGDDKGNLFGAFTSTSWAETEGGWIGNGDSFIFSLKPKMAVFFATGKDDNIMYLDKEKALGLGGREGHFGLSIDANLERGNFNGDIETFDLPVSNLIEPSFGIEHVEVWALGPETSPEKERSKLHFRKPNRDVRGGGNVDMDDLMSQIS